MNKSFRTISNILVGFIILLVLLIPSTGLTRDVDPKKYEKYLPSGNYQYTYGWGTMGGTIVLKKNFNNVNYMQVMNSELTDVNIMLMIIDETKFEGATSYDDLKIGDDVAVKYTWVKIEQDKTEIYMADMVSVPSKIKRSKEEVLSNKAFDYYRNCFNSRGSDKKQCIEAIKLYTKAIAINPKYIEAYFERAVAYGFIGKVDSGLNDFKKVLTIDPANKDVYRKRANFYLRLKQCAKAVADFEMHFKINPDSNWYSERAEAYYCSGNYKAAIEDFSKEISRQLARSKRIGEDPTIDKGWGNLAFQYFYRGAAYVKIGDNESGLNDFGNVLGIIPTFESNFPTEPLLADKDIRKIFNLAKGLRGK